jgi:AraC-like DNA-binding protein
VVAGWRPHGRDVEADRTAAVVRAIDLMRAGLGSPQPLAVLARSGMFSPFYFHRVFRELTGVTPARFLAALRMAEACRLLLHSAASVAGIGAHVGYTSVGTFTTQFGRLVGLSPARFRGVARSLAGMRVGELLPALRGVPDGRTGATLALSGAPTPESLVVGRLFPAGRRYDRQDLCTLAAGPGTVRLPAVPWRGGYVAFSMVVPAPVRLVDAFVDDLPGSRLVGRAHIWLTPDGQSRATIPATLRRPGPTDPPALAVTPLRRLIDLTRCHRVPAP